MDQATRNKIVSFIWGIADDVLRGLFRHGEYPDVICADFLAIEKEPEGMLLGRSPK